MEVKQLDDYFGYTEKGSSLEGELRAGLTTFLTMAYILLVNPAMLSGTGIGFNEALFATAIAAFIGCTVMGLWANLPFALAPGMGLNAYFTFTVVIGMGIDWEVALAAVFVEGLIFMIISLPQVGWRTLMINSIPTDLKIATGAGIGMFLALIGLEETGLVINNGVTLVDIGLTGTWTYQSGELIAIVGLIAITAMMVRNIPGALVLGIVLMSIYGWLVSATDPYNTLGNADALVFYEDAATGAAVDILATPNFLCEDETCFYPDINAIVAVNAPAGWGADVATAPELGFGEGKLMSTEGFDTGAVGAALGALADVGDTVPVGQFLLVMITFLFVDIFDTAGTLYSVGRAAGYVDENDELHNSDEAFMSDAAATIVGAVCGTSTTTTYIESAAGVEEGGRTGLTSVTVGVLMLSGLLFSGLFQAIPQFAMATALIVVGAMMMRQVPDIAWDELEIAVPAFLTMVLMPFTFSIADGIAWGVISYVAIQILVGKAKDLNVVMWTLFVLMTMFYLGPGQETTFEWILGSL
jgi:AGZA family xanthine/uracil permease-like MFS transporter